MGPTLGPSLVYFFCELVFRVRVRVYRVASFESESTLLGKSLKTRTTEQKITRSAAEILFYCFNLKKVISFIDAFRKGSFSFLALCCSACTAVLTYACCFSHSRTYH